MWLGVVSKVLSPPPTPGTTAGQCSQTVLAGCDMEPWKPIPQFTVIQTETWVHPTGTYVFIGCWDSYRALCLWPQPWWEPGTGPFILTMPRAEQNRILPGRRPAITDETSGCTPKPGRSLWEQTPLSWFSPGGFWAVHQAGLGLRYSTESVTTHRLPAHLDLTAIQGSKSGSKDGPTNISSLLRISGNRSTN